MKTKWRVYNRSIIPLAPPHIKVQESPLEIQKIVQKSNVLFARWISNFDCNEQLNFWYVINDIAMDMSDYSRNTRNQIRKGLRNFEIKIVDKTIIE